MESLRTSRGFSLSIKVDEDGSISVLGEIGNSSYAFRIPSGSDVSWSSFIEGKSAIISPGTVTRMIHSKSQEGVNVVIFLTDTSKALISIQMEADNLLKTLKTALDCEGRAVVDTYRHRIDNYSMYGSYSNGNITIHVRIGPNVFKFQIDSICEAPLDGWLKFINGEYDEIHVADTTITSGSVFGRDGVIVNVCTLIRNNTGEPEVNVRFESEFLIPTIKTIIQNYKNSIWSKRS